MQQSAAEKDRARTGENFAWEKIFKAKAWMHAFSIFIINIYIFLSFKFYLNI